MNIYRIYFLLCLLGFSFFIGCKKGANDPVFSLQTRKARLVNDWKVSFEEIVKGDTTFIFDGKTQQIKIGDIDLSQVETSQTITFNRNGDYTMNSSQNFPKNHLGNNKAAQTINLLETGKWSFSSGGGDIKNKEQLILLPNRMEKRIEGFSEVEILTWDGQTTAKVYRIDMLKPNEMRWIYNQKTNTPYGVTTVSGTIEFTSK